MTIDYSRFDDLLAQRAARDWGMDIVDLYAIADLLKAGATPDDLKRHMLERFPSWTGRAGELEVIIGWVQRGTFE